MGILKERFASKFETVSTEIKEIIKEHGSKKIGEVSLSQVYQGMRGITGLVTETSLLDSQEGIRFRGYTIPELQEKLPKAPNGTEPLPEGLLYLMLIGELPTAEDVQHVTNVLQRRIPNKEPFRIFYANYKSSWRMWWTCHLRRNQNSCMDMC